MTTWLAFNAIVKADKRRAKGSKGWIDDGWQAAKCSRFVPCLACRRADVQIPRTAPSRASSQGQGPHPLNCLMSAALLGRRSIT